MNNRRNNNRRSNSRRGWGGYKPRSNSKPRVKYVYVQAQPKPTVQVVQQVQKPNKKSKPNSKRNSRSNSKSSKKSGKKNNRSQSKNKPKPKAGNQLNTSNSASIILSYASTLMSIDNTTTDKTAMFVLNPGYATFTWLANMAKQFGQYQILQFGLEYRPNTSLLTTGYFYVYFDPSMEKSIDLSKAENFENRNKVKPHSFRNHCLLKLSNKVNRKTLYLAQTPGVYQEGTQLDNDFGNLYIRPVGVVQEGRIGVIRICLKVKLLRPINVIKTSSATGILIQDKNWPSSMDQIPQYWSMDDGYLTGRLNQFATHINDSGFGQGAVVTKPSAGRIQINWTMPCIGTYTLQIDSFFDDTNQEAYFECYYVADGAQIAVAGMDTYKGKLTNLCYYKELYFLNVKTENQGFKLTYVNIGGAFKVYGVEFTFYLCNEAVTLYEQYINWLVSAKTLRLIPKVLGGHSNCDFDDIIRYLVKQGKPNPLVYLASRGRLSSQVKYQNNPFVEDFGALQFKPLYGPQVEKAQDLKPCLKQQQQQQQVVQQVQPVQQLLNHESESSDEDSLDSELLDLLDDLQVQDLTEPTRAEIPDLL